MGITFCITSQKGGVGKTTTAVNLAAAMALTEKKVLLVDCDPQGHATVGVGIDKTRLKASLYHALTDNVDPMEIMVNNELKFLKTLPAGIELALAEVELMKQPSGQKRLRCLLEDIKAAFDYIVIDSPPSINLLTTNAIIAADFLLIPLQCEFYALEGLGPLLQTIKIIKQKLHPGLKLAGILLTMLDKRKQISRDIAQTVGEQFQSLLCKTVIYRNDHLLAAASQGKPIVLSDVMSSGARSYLDLAHELMSLQVVGNGNAQDRHNEDLTAKGV